MVGQAIQELEAVGNSAEMLISLEQPWTARVRVRGVAPYLYHRWQDEEVEEKSKAAKGSTKKKTDNLESYVYRDGAGNLALPTEQFRQALVGAARFRQDPRSPRKSAMDLYKAGLAGMAEWCPLGIGPDWHYVDQRRAVVQRSSITRRRPAIFAGWETTVEIGVLVPEYITPEMLNETFQQAGRLMGVGDFRPTYGRFQVVGFEVSQS